MLVMELDVELDNTLMIPSQHASNGTRRIGTKET